MIVRRVGRSANLCGTIARGTRTAGAIVYVTNFLSRKSDIKKNNRKPSKMMTCGYSTRIRTSNAPRFTSCPYRMEPLWPEAFPYLQSGKRAYSSSDAIKEWLMI